MSLHITSYNIIPPEADLLSTNLGPYLSSCVILSNLVRSHKYWIRSEMSSATL